MAQKTSIDLLGDKELKQLFLQLPKTFTKKVFQDASMSPARRVAKSARAVLENSPAFKNKNTDRGYSKLLQVARKIRVKRLKSVVAIMPGDTPDVIVKGSKRPRWTLYGWSMLLAKGRKWTSKGARKTHYTGVTDGAGDYVAQGYRKVRGDVASLYSKNVKRVLQRNIKRFKKKL